MASVFYAVFCLMVVAANAHLAHLSGNLFDDPFNVIFATLINQMFYGSSPWCKSGRGLHEHWRHLFRLAQLQMYRWLRHRALLWRFKQSMLPEMRCDMYCQLQNKIFEFTTILPHRFLGLSNEATWSQSDSACTAMSGTCQDKSNYCSG